MKSKLFAPVDMTVGEPVITLAVYRMGKWKAKANLVAG